jgi:hypothetical protein
MRVEEETKFKQLALVSQNLHSASVQLSEQITEVESALNDLNLGISAWIELRRFTKDDDEAESPIPWSENLGYGKHSGKWGVLCTSYCELTNNPGEVPKSFLREASRDTRMAAVEKIPELLELLAHKATSVAKEASEKAAQAKEIATDLRKK